MKVFPNFLFIVFIFFPILNGNAQDSVQTGKASYYHDSFHGQETSNGESYNKNDFTAAHRTMPFGAILLVTNKKNNKSVIVRINDRGPFAKSRVIDLSFAAAKKIEMVPFGVVQVRITLLTYLDSSKLNDSKLLNGEVWDCYGNKHELRKGTLSLWKTEDLKHALYMASALSLEKKTDVLIKVHGENANRFYTLLISDLESAQMKELKKYFSKSGFRVSELNH